MTHEPLSDDELAGLERDVRTALATADPSGLTLLGEGEITLVLGAGDGPTWACKRLPPFATDHAATRYAATIERYLDELSQRGIDVVDTSVRRLSTDDGHVVLYCVQPVLPSATLAVGIARGDAEVGRRLLEEIVGLVLASVGERFGLDAQLSNWALVDDRLVYLDVTTPLLRDADGADLLDSDVFLVSFPWVLRSPVRRFVVPGIIDRYHDRRTVVVDLAANLVKEGLDHLVPAVVDASRGAVTPALTIGEIRRDRRADLVTWTALQWARRLDRAWQRGVRRRAYPLLLPTHRHS